MHFFNTSDLWAHLFYLAPPAYSQPILSLNTINPYAPGRINWQRAEGHLKKDSSEVNSVVGLEQVVKQKNAESPNPVFFEMVFYLANDDYSWFWGNWYPDDEDQDYHKTGQERA